VLAPGRPDDVVQVIDVRDLAAWIVRAADEGLGGTFNAVDRPTTRAALIDACRTSDVELVWVDGDFLAEQGVGEWMELPLWLHSPEYRGMLAVDPSPAFEAGLETRPLVETARDTLAWVRAGDGPDEPPAGLGRDRERELLDSWASKD
jgi:hypothetical protein